MSLADAERIYAITETKGGHIRRAHADEDAAEMLRPCSKELDDYIGTFPWKVTASYPFSRPAHINLQEARALTREIRLMAVRGFSPRRVLCALDSSVVVGACAKGRSPSLKLNGILRCNVGNLIFSRISYFVF